MRADALAAFAVEGADAASFLQGQISADALALQNGHWARAAYCNRQGRVLANAILCRESGEKFCAIARADIAEDCIARLSRFVLRAKVKMRREECGVCFVVFANAPPEKGGTFRREENGDIAVLECGDSGGDDGCAADWKTNDILRGMPWVGAKTQEKFLPQFINWDLLGGIDFNKGCYVGQEVVARLHYRGAVKRRLMIVRGDGDSPEEGAAIADDKGATVGEIVNAAAVAEEGGDGYIALAAVMLARVKDSLFCGGQQLLLSPAPVPAESEESPPQQSSSAKPGVLLGA